MAIETAVSEGVAEVVIANPPVNALDSAGWFAFAEAVQTVGARDDVNCVVIRAEGRGFQAGVDIKELAEDGTKIVDVNRGCYDTFAAIYDCPVPVISAVHGYCLGGGIGISGASDIVIASEDATFSLPEIDRGALGAATHLMRLFGMQKTRRMLYTGEAIDAQKALDIGLAWRVVPHHDLMAEARALADRLCRAAPLAARATKEVAVRTRDMGWTEAVRFGETMRRVAGATHDATEGRTAWREKRSPEWEGR